MLQIYRGPVALDEIEAAIGCFDEALLTDDDAGASVVPMTEVVGYLWKCGCEARGNGSPFCVWYPCGPHRSRTASLPLRAVPSRYDGGTPVPRDRVRPVRVGDVVVSAKDAIEASRAAGSPVGYVEDGKVIREFPDGRREILALI
jgi:hypothetical protein